MRIPVILGALFPATRARILIATLAHPDKEWYLTELARSLKTQPSSLQREVETLAKAGVLCQRREGRRIYLKPNVDSPVYADLKHLFDKTAGIIPVLAHQLKPLGARIRLAFVFGSVARSQETSESDVDLLLVGSAGLSDVVPALRRAEKSLGRPVNPTVYSEREFRAKFRGKDHFLTAVLHGEKKFVKGSEHELESITR